MISQAAPDISGPMYLKTGNRWYYVISVEPSNGKNLKDDGSSWIYKASCVDSKGQGCSIALHNDGGSYQVQSAKPAAFKHVPDEWLTAKASKT